MNVKLKKALIITSSSVLLFFTVFFLTKSLNNVISSSDEENIINIEDTASADKVNESIDTQEKSQEETKDNMNNVNTASENQEENKMTNSNSVQKHIEYTVKQGDTLFSIARELMPWKGQEEAVNIISSMNNLKNSEILTVGSKLMIPVNTIDTSNCLKYIVRDGDSLYSIASEYLPNMNVNDAVESIMEKNNISNPSALSVGLEIYIPNGEANASNSVENENNE